MSGKFKTLLTDFYKSGDQPLPEYPRPHFQRDSYLSLNGVWDFTSSKKKKVSFFDEQIIVPFSPESVLSGVKRKIKRGDYLLYQKEVCLPSSFNKGRLFLHFGAVDQEVVIYINGEFVKRNTLAFFPFNVEITEYVKGNKFTIFLRVKDKTRQGAHFVGKQKVNRGGIWYTPQSGIWQSVWLESTNDKYLENVVITPSFDRKTVTFQFQKQYGTPVEIIVYEKGVEIKRVKVSTNQSTLIMSNIIAWTPENPFLYDVTFNYENDVVTSYFAFRKVSSETSPSGHKRFYLNNVPLFQSGVLDQGYYSDGLLTPPSEEAMIKDITLLKEMGFNMLRKHIKIEPLRFYYLCDKLGMLVWQDMPNLAPPKHYNINALLAMFLGIHRKDVNSPRFGIITTKQKEMYYIGLNKLVETLGHFPSIVTWVPFNEGWGQFDATKVSEKLKSLDPTRLIDHASGWSDQGSGDYYSEHIYFTKLKKNEKRVKNRIFALTEFGGYSYKEKDHSFNLRKTFGYRVYEDKTALELGFISLYENEVLPLIKEGLDAIIYTQLSDVEDEVNGLITYDRKVIKLAVDVVKNANQKLFDEFERLFHNEL